MQNILEKVVSFLFLIVNFFLNLIFSISTNLIPPPDELFEVNMVANITSPQQVVWKSDDLIIFITDGDIWEYSISKDSSTNLGKREPNEFVGVGDDGQILLCTIEHFTISSPDEFSTRLVVKDTESDESKEMYFFETIRPISLDSEKIIAVTAVDFLEQFFYEIDIESGDMREIEEPRKNIRQIYIPEEVVVKDIDFSDSGDYVIEDIFGNVYVGIRRKSKNSN